MSVSVSVGPAKPKFKVILIDLARTFIRNLKDTWAKEGVKKRGKGHLAVFLSGCGSLSYSYLCVRGS